MGLSVSSCKALVARWTCPGGTVYTTPHLFIYPLDPLQRDGKDAEYPQLETGTPQRLAHQRLHRLEGGREDLGPGVVR